MTIRRAGMLAGFVLLVTGVAHAQVPLDPRFQSVTNLEGTYFDSGGTEVYFGKFYPNYPTTVDVPLIINTEGGGVFPAVPPTVVSSGVIPM